MLSHGLLNCLPSKESLLSHFREKNPKRYTKNLKKETEPGLSWDHECLTNCEFVRSQFIAHILMHHFGTPLNSITGFQGLKRLSQMRSKGFLFSW
jgi:hypothetical protein